jgi:hypothetical protein
VQAHIAAMSRDGNDAVALLTGQKYIQAMAALNDIVSDVPSGYASYSRNATRRVTPTRRGEGPVRQRPGGRWSRQL